MRARSAVLLALVWLAPVGTASPSADCRKVYDQRLANVVARQGVQHRSLVLVALVARRAPDPSTLRVDAAPIQWAPTDAKAPGLRSSLSWRKQGTGVGSTPVVLPSGLVLRAGNHERLLARPLLLSGEQAAVVRSTPLTTAEAAPDAAGAEHVIDGIAPPEYGHTQFLLRDRDALADLLDLEASALGVDTKTTPPSLAVLAATGDANARIAACVADVTPLGGAYGGETVGHVAFFGEGVVQFVLAGAPETYRSYVKNAARGLGLGVTVWEALYGKTDELPGDVRWDDYVAATARLIKHLRAASFKSERRADEEGAAGALWRVRATKATQPGRPPDVGWLLLDDAGAPVLFEAWPDNAPLPPPPGAATAPDPGAVDRDRNKQGAQTWAFVKRFYERFPWRHVPEWVRRRQDR